MTPTETIDAIAQHRTRAEQRRRELLAERRALSVQALSSGASTAAKAAGIAGELRALDDTLADLVATEAEARETIRLEVFERDVGVRVETIRKAGQLLSERSQVAAQMDAAIDSLLVLAERFDAVDVQAHVAATRYGRHDTLSFSRPPGARDLIFERLAAIGALSPVHTSGIHVNRSTILAISNELGASTWGHLEQFLPRRERVPVATAVLAPAAVAAAVADEPVEEPWTEDAPLEGELEPVR